ncbi:MAG: IS21 family transposase [Bacilli bacterium]|nr:IS21 family transposase [Bacilli bacterium]
MDEIKPNYSEISRRFNCDPRTVKRYYEGGKKVRKKKMQTSKLDPYKEIIESKLDLGVTVTGIYHFIINKGYEGKYTILRDYARKLKIEKTKKATIRIETNKGLSAQVDWKENFTLHTKSGEKITFNIFLMVLGYSRYKFIEPAFNRDQKTLFECLARGFEDIGGVPQEIWFDNMKTVVDQAKTQYSQVVFNQHFYHFSKDMNFIPIACRPYRPQTKGKVESLARLTKRLKAYDYEIDGIEDIFSLIYQFKLDINDEISQATKKKPYDLLLKEKEYLNPLPPQEIIHGYQDTVIIRKVSKESMIVYGGLKYSVSPQYIAKIVNLEIDNDILHIYYNRKLIRTHKITKETFNYHKDDAKEILKSDVFRYKSDLEIENFIEGNLKVYDDI